MDMDGYKRGKLLAEGKTKRIFAVDGQPGLVIIEHKDAITAHDNPAFTREFATKARCSTQTTSRIFAYLEHRGVLTAFVTQISDTEFVARRCRMLPLEAVARRYAVGSYLKRNPEFAVSEGLPPHRFDSPILEFFLKTTGGELRDTSGKILASDLDPLRGEEDPLIQDYLQPEWRLFHSKKPYTDSEADLHKTVQAVEALEYRDLRIINFMESHLLKTFGLLEQAWEQVGGYHLIDMKIEFGITTYCVPVVADVIDNDSWRLRTRDWQELSKEVFRNGGDLSVVEQNYIRVAELVEQF